MLSARNHRRCLLWSLKLMSSIITLWSSDGLGLGSRGILMWCWLSIVIGLFYLKVIAHCNSSRQMEWCIICVTEKWPFSTCGLVWCWNCSSTQRFFISSHKMYTSRPLSNQEIHLGWLGSSYVRRGTCVTWGLRLLTVKICKDFCYWFLVRIYRLRTPTLWWHWTNYAHWGCHTLQDSTILYFEYVMTSRRV